eukprot:15446953-Alexandrium_andersonii.AAC.1
MLRLPQMLRAPRRVFLDSQYVAKGAQSLLSGCQDLPSCHGRFLEAHSPCAACQRPTFRVAQSAAAPPAISRSSMLPMLA